MDPEHYIWRAKKTPLRNQSPLTTPGNPRPHPTHVIVIAKISTLKNHGSGAFTPSQAFLTYPTFIRGLRLRKGPRNNFFLHMIKALGFHAEEASKRKRYPTRPASGGVGMWVGGLAIISLVIVISNLCGAGAFLGQGEGKREDGGLQRKKKKERSARRCKLDSNTPSQSPHFRTRSQSTKTTQLSKLRIPRWMMLLLSLLLAWCAGFSVMKSKFPLLTRVGSLRSW